MTAAGFFGSTLTYPSSTGLKIGESSQPGYVQFTSSVFHAGYTYIGIGTTTPLHMLEGYESWPGDNSTRWILYNSSNGYSVIEAGNTSTTDSTKIVYAGNGPSSGWFTGYDGRNMGGVVVGGSSPGFFYVAGSSLAMGTDVNAPIEFFVNNTKRGKMTANGFFAKDTPHLVGVSSTAANTTCTSTVPEDDSIPQSNEGCEFLSTTFTAVSADGLLHVHGSIPFGSTAGGAIACSLYQNSAANALRTVSGRVSAGSSVVIDFNWLVDAISISDNLTIRCGNSGVGTIMVNSTNGTGRVYGGASRATLAVYENGQTIP